MTRVNNKSVSACAKTPTLSVSRFYFIFDTGSLFRARPRIFLFFSSQPPPSEQPRINEFLPYVQPSTVVDTRCPPPPGAPPPLEPRYYLPEHERRTRRKDSRLHAASRFYCRRNHRENKWLNQWPGRAISSSILTLERTGTGKRGYDSEIGQGFRWFFCND